MCKTDSEWEAAMWLRELSLLLCDDLEGQDGGGEGGSGRWGPAHTHGQFMLMCERNQHDIVKNYPPAKNKYFF